MIRRVDFIEHSVRLDAQIPDVNCCKGVLFRGLIPTRIYGRISSGGALPVSAESVRLDVVRRNDHSVSKW